MVECSIHWPDPQINRDALSAPLLQCERRYFEFGHVEFMRNLAYLNQTVFSNRIMVIETFFISPNNPKCKVICTSVFELGKIAQITSRYLDFTVL